MSTGLFWKKKLVYYRDWIMAHIYPKYLANQVYRYVFKKDINWKNPTNLIEKIYWLQLNTDTSLWTLCADKYRVRQFVEERGCGEILNKLYGVWNNADEIDFDSLPNSFVLKTNNSCGQIILVKDKKELDIADAKRKLKTWMNTTYGYQGAQLHYTRIKPCIIAEELLINSKNKDKSLVDYKIWCFDGKVECILVAGERTWSDTGVDGYSLSMYDKEWKNISDKALNTNNKHFDGKDFEKPASLERMLEYASILSKGFPEVRVDFYEINDKPVFGELTFTTGYGSYKTSFYEYLGSKIDLQDYIKK
ncbi:MAG: hypothetical protein IJX41_06115 [Bacteroidaceae bacterium]|nr:hypothetical protein [Bacteroidaceae bacterium]